MSWMANLYETYEQAKKLDLSQDPDKPSLMPVSHTLQNAHINITIDGNGNFRNAEVLEKKQVMLPATEKSAGRSSGEAPHPLADKLQYVAQDYAAYGGTKKAYFDSYKVQLKQWCESSFTHLKAMAVYRYIEQGNVIRDLINAKVLHVDNNNVLLTYWADESDSEPPRIFKVLPKKSGAIEMGDALVCWSVEILGDKCTETWKDESLQQSWIDFDASNEAEQGVCVISGKTAPLAINHPAKLRHTGDKAKLISSNDKDGFTYRGRFLDAVQAGGISFDVTQKAHNALRWLISGSQGYRNGEQAIVAWVISKELPSPVEDPWKFIDEDDIKEIIDVENKVEQKSIDHSRDLGQLFSKKLKKKLAGYRQSLGEHEAVTIMVIDSASPGRMNISYYRETNAKDFFNQLDLWYTDFEWPQRVNVPLENKKKKSKVVWFESPPVPLIIVKAAYGENVDDKLKKSTIERLLPCIVENKPIPKDLVDACVRNASNPFAYQSDEKWRWNRNISVACALYKGYCNRKLNKDERRKYTMSLEREYTGRDYLYGRLLALAEMIERKALDNAGEKRITNAERLMQRFSSRPYTTWETIHKSLRPYQDRLRISEASGLLNYWEKEIEEINTLFKEPSIYSDDNPLSGEYLLGYYCQKNYRKPKSADDKKSENEIN